MPSISVRGAQRSAEQRFARFGVALLLALIGFALCAGRAVAQQPTSVGAGVSVRLSLDDALRIAQVRSQTIEVARTGVTRATGQHLQTRSQLMPQLNGSAAYGRTLQSQFSGFATSSTPDTVVTPTTKSLCTPFIASSATPAERAAALAQAATCPAASSSGGLDFSKTSFGAKNQYTFSLAFSQNVYSGGRIAAQNSAAEAQLRSANIEVAAQRAQVSFDVTSAYYDAVLADQFVAIADSSVAQTDLILAQTRVARQVGNSSEYELLRAQVTRDNQLPVRIQARSNRQVAYLRLKQLLNMPLDDSLQLTTGIEGQSGPTLPAVATSVAMDTSIADRAPVRQLDEAVHAQEAQIKIARSQRIPSLAIVSNYQRLYFPVGSVPSLTTGVNNWTLGLSTSLPILDGGRIKGDVMIAEAGLAQARAQRELAREFAALDTRVALNALQEAQATWEASRGTADQAQRAYSIDEVRFREGISTQTDLTQSRLLLEQSRANRAQAARNLAVARVRLALLRDLPLAAAGTGGTGGGASGAAAQQQQVQQSQQRSAGSTSAAGSGPTGGIQP